MPPNHLQIEACCDSQYAFIHDEHVYALAAAGIGSGKTYAGAIKSFLKAVQYPGIRICVTAPSYKVLNDATCRTYQDVFGLIPGFANFLHGDNPMANCKNGSEILFRSTDNPNGLRGMEIGSFHMDEPRDSPFYAFQVLQGRLRQRNKAGDDFYPLQGYLTTTPRGLNWIYSEFILEKKLDHVVFRWSTSDNKYLPKDYAARMQRDYSGQEKLLAQETKGEFLNTEGDCVFDRGNLARILEDDCRDPQFIEDVFVNIWKPPIVSRRYVAGVDCADEGGGGVNCCTIIDWLTGEEVCEIWGDIASDVFVELINKWGRKYNDCTMGIERNGVGNYVVAKMEDLLYPNLYRDEHGKIGHFTSVFNRTTVLEDYHIAVDRNQTCIRSAKAIEEMLTFIRKANDKWEHIDGCRDDRIFARAIAWKMRNNPQALPSGVFSVKRAKLTYA